LIAIMFSIILNYLYRHEVVYALTEGQTLSNSQASYLREFGGPLYNDAGLRYEISLENVDESFEVDGSYTRAADILISSENGSAIEGAKIYTNNPLKWNDLEFHMGARSGYSPELTVNDSTGNTLFKSFVRLASRTENGRIVYSDYIFLGTGNIKVEITVKPDSLDNESVSYLLAVYRNEDLLCSAVSIGGAKVGCADFKISVPRLRRWCYINAVESPFQNLIFFAFWSALAGMAIGFIPRLIMRKERNS